MSRKILSLFTILFIISAIAAPAYADQTIFGPKDLKIGRWHVHLSSHRFTVDDPSDGVLTIVKNTPDKEIRGGFCFLNGKYIGLSNFLKGTGTLFEKDVNLRSNNRITVFLRGTPGASIKIEINKKGVTPPPEVTFTADPATIYVGQSSTLSWTSTNADTCVIEPGIGSVDLNGSTTVSPTETTTYTISATGLGGTKTANVMVTIANSAPVANDQTVTLNEDETAPIILTASDVNSDALTYQIVTGPSHGTLTGSAPNLTYTPLQNYNGSDTFTFKANDGSLDSNTATVTLSIQSVNDAPTAVDDTVTTNEDTAIAVITVLANDTDPDGDTLTVDDFTQPAHGTAGSNGDGTLTYTPDLNYNGNDSFTYTVSDGNGGTDTAAVNITINPVNDAPVANNQTVTLNEDATASITLTASDADGDALTYQIVSSPSHGTLTGNAPDIIYTPAVSYYGNDSFTFIVNDGTVGSGDATVTITVNPINDPPVADAGPDQTALQGSTITLDGSSSSDIDGDTITYNWTFISVPTGSTATLSDSSIVNPTFTADLIGTYEVRLIVNDGTVNSAPDTIVVNIVALPTVEISANPTTILTGESSTLTWTSTNADTCVIEPGIGSVALNGSTTVLPAETTTYTITATGADGTATASVTVNVNEQAVPPTVSFSASPATIAQGESSVLSWSSDGAQSVHIDNGIGNVDVNGSTTVSPEHTTTYTITVTGSGGSANAKATVKVTGNPEPQPDGSFGQQFENLIPPDATVEEYDPKRFSIITGLVQNIESLPIVDVFITIHDHPEYGTVATDAEGRFSIPVDGGSTITVVYQKQGLISAHRKVYVSWNDFAIVDTIQMIAEDTASTTIIFDGNPNTVVTHQSTRVTDEFGSRSATIVFTGDNSAWLVDENGNDVHELSNISVRATEFTTSESMPAVLPPTSAYTYCAELQVDGVQRVRFDKPVVGYVENFIGFNVGTIAPVGYYDRDRGVWVPSQNGVVVKLLDIDSDGVVDALDIDGDDQPDVINGEEFIDEVIGLDNPSIYAPGATFWRIEMRHFTPCDINWPFVPPPDAIKPNVERIPTLDDQECLEDECKGVGNSYVEERSRVFHEDIPIAGTDLTLHYASNRINTNKIVIHVPLSGETVPNSLKRIVAKIKYFMHAETKYLDPLPNQKTTFEIEIDRRISKLVVFIGFTYDGYYQYPSPRYLYSAFAKFGNANTFNRTRNEVTIWRIHSLNISQPISNNGTFNLIADGWTISNNHTINPSNPFVLNRGDGDKIEALETDCKYRKIDNVNLIENIAGNRIQGYGGDGGPATQAQLASPRGIAVDAVGNIYIADYNNYRVRKVDRDGTITTVAGNGTQGNSGNGGPAIYAQLYEPRDVAVDATGNLYIADTGCGAECEHYDVIRKVDTNGIITTVAGDVTGGGGEGSVVLYGARSVATDPVGNLYIGEYEKNVILQVDPNGILSTIVGNGISGYSGDGGPAGEAELNRPKGITLDVAGNLYIADSENHCIRKVDPSGFITTIAGDGNQGYSGDGGPAQEAQLYRPIDVNIDVEGNIYIVDSGNQCIRKVNTEGIIYTVAGQGANSYNGDGVPVDPSWYTGYTSVAVDDSGMMYVSFSADNVISSVGPIVPYVYVHTISGNVFADKNGLGYYMSPFGLHLKTIDLNTGITLQEFGYDSDKRIISILDRFNNETRIERGSGIPTTIISPDNIRTELTIDTDNFLTHITYPDGNYYSFEYSLEGLMTAEIEPNGNRFIHNFTPDNKIADVIDEEGWHTSYEKAYLYNGDILTETITAEGNRTTYLDRTDSSGNYTSIITDPTGGVTNYSRSGLMVDKTLPCGTVLWFKNGIDPKYRYKFIKEKTEETPAGLTKTYLRDKTYTDTNDDDISDLITETVAVNNKTTNIENNILQSQKTVTTHEGRTVTTQYNPATLLTESVSIPGINETNYVYDSQGRIASVSIGSRDTTFSRNAQGFIDSFTDPEGYTTTYTHDSIGRVTGIGRPDGSSLGFTYDGNGNMTVLTNPSSIQHGFGYNAANLNNSYQTPISGTYSYVYDRDRRLVHTNFPSGRQINNVYNTTQLSQVQTPEGNIDYTYLCGTTVESITKGTEAITFGYDGKLVTSVDLTGTLNQSLGYTYNNDFNVTGFTYAGDTENYTYDNDGFLTGAGSFTITRNAQNGLPEVVNGGALNQARTFNSYGEQDGQVSAISGQSVSSWSLAQDDNGQITQKIEIVNGITSNYDYTYDPMGRLITVTKDGSLVEEYDYDINGTRIYEMNTLRGISGRSFTYSDEDHLLTAATTSYQYDLDGFLTTKTDGTDVTTYNYSSRGELLNATLPDGRIIEYIHDPLGRRIAKIVDGITIEKYLWQGLTRLLAVYDGSNNLIMRFEYADGRMPVAMTSGGATYYLTYDQVGSLKAVADSAGNVVKRIDYDSFGNIIGDTDPLFDMPFSFAGGLHDRDTELVRFGYRDYDPDTGRWTVKDPILFAGGDTDLFGYCLNDPVNKVDYFGLWSWNSLVPRYGTWGGPGWSGGNTFPHLGPVDSMDECFKKHDECYGWGKDPCYSADKKDCDKKLVECLENLGKSPRNWPIPPENPLHAELYRDWAMTYFMTQSR